MDEGQPRYKIIQEIGRGAFGVVLLAYDNRLERNVALKALAVPEGLSGEDHKQLIDRFYREARAAASLSHPNIVIIHDISRTKDRHFISMEYLDGQPLNDIVCRGPMGLERALAIADQVLAGLAYAHSKGVVHRDIKPENIFVIPDDAVKLVDFGLARVQTTTTLTKSGMVVGTPGYISPEAIRGKPADSRSDIFSFGATFYEMLAGKRPFGPDSAFDTYVSVIYRIVQDDPGPPSTYNQAVPRELDLIVGKCLAKEPSERFQSAESVRGYIAQLKEAVTERGAKGARGISALEEAILKGAPAGAGHAPTPEPALQPVQDSDEYEAFPTRTPFVIRSRGADAAAQAQAAESAQPATAAGAGAPAYAPARQYPAAARGRRIPWRKVIPIAAVLVVGIFIGLYFLGLLPFLPRGLRCPDLKGKTVAEADKALKDVGLALGKQSEEFSGDMDKGKVVSQKPGAGGGMKKGASVDVVLSKGRETAAVPDLTSKSGDEARATLEGLGFQVNKVDDYSSTVAPGNVIYTDPRGGTVLANGTAVIVVVSVGARPSTEAPQTPSSSSTAQPTTPGGPTAVTCSTCGGSGKVTCSTCGGSGTVTRSVACSRCGGSGVDPDGGVCTLCGGKGSTTTSVTCSTCGGSGRATCPTCGGSGKIQAVLLSGILLAGLAHGTFRARRRHSRPRHHKNATW